MIDRKILMACLAGASVLSATLVYAEEDVPAQKKVRVTISGKMWNESWSTWNRVGYFTGYGPGTLINTGDVAPALIGGATVRIKDFFISGNYAPQKEFNFPDVNNKYKRSEYDVNFGYYLHPQVALSFGRKQVKLQYDPNSIWTHDFLTVGINSSAGIGETRFFMYENAAQSLTGSTSVTFALTGTKGTPIYQSLEGGLGFSATQNLIFTAGYKFQQVELPISWSYPYTPLTEKTRDTTTGFIFGAAYTF